MSQIYGLRYNGVKAVFSEDLMSLVHLARRQIGVSGRYAIDIITRNGDQVYSISMRHHEVSEKIADTVKNQVAPLQKRLVPA